MPKDLFPKLIFGMYYVFLKLISDKGLKQANSISAKALLSLVLINTLLETVESVPKPVPKPKPRFADLEAKRNLYSYKPSSEERRFHKHQQRLFNNLYFA